MSTSTTYTPGSYAHYYAPSASHQGDTTMGSIDLDTALTVGKLAVTAIQAIAEIVSAFA